MSFLNENFLLDTEEAKHLYFSHAEQLPIIDYHNHLSPKEVADDTIYKSITNIWLEGDHYKWRAMRANGVEEQLITGGEGVSDYSRFEAWAKTVPYTMRNPLYHWTHMELKKPFGITELLNEKTSKNIYDATNESLQDPSYSAQGLLKKAKVQVLCTTDSPLDNLEHHIRNNKAKNGISMFPTFRPDEFINIEHEGFLPSLEKLSEITKSSIDSYDDLLTALQDRINYFSSHGCRVSDHGIGSFPVEDYTDAKIKSIFSKVVRRENLSELEINQYKSAIMIDLCKMYHDKNWIQQFHFGVLRNNNTRYMNTIGKDTGFDCMGSWNHAISLNTFFDRLDVENKLAKTILYNLNPVDNNMLATVIGNFNVGNEPGKIQFGSGWWFNDQKLGMIDQMNALSNHGLLSRFVGMLTDSRSMLSFSRHEYFRRILCQLIGKDIANGELPNDMEWIGKMVENICYYNALHYFGFEKDIQ